MDQSRKRAREAEEEAAAMRRQRQHQHQQEADNVAAQVVEALQKGTYAMGLEEPWQHPPGVFELPWKKCRDGLGGLGSGVVGWDLRDVFFRSLVDGGAAAIGIPGDRLASPLSKQPARFGDLDALLAGAEEQMWLPETPNPDA